MATTLGTLSNFIAGERAPSDGETESDSQPRDRRGAGAGAQLDAGGRRPRVRARRARRSRGGRRRRRRSAPRRCSRWRTRSRSTARSSRALEAINAGKPLAAVTNDEIPRDGRQPALLRRRRALPGGSRGGRVHGGVHVVHPARGGRRDRADHAVELPADDGDLEDRAGARDGQHDRAEARRDDARSRRCGSRSWPPRSCRPACSTSSDGRGEPTGQALVEHPDVDMVSLTGSVDTGKRIARTAARHAQARAPRARRQGAGDRLRRRRARERARDDRGHRLLQRRTGLHGGDARAGRRRRLRRRRRRARRAGAGAS